VDPIVLSTIAEVRREIAQARAAGKSIGFVPTMGALHEGHGALMDRARRQCDYVAVSIFVNPIQFDRRDDYEAYRIDLSCDTAFCAGRGVDMVFAPPPTEMYPSEPLAYVDVARLSEHLCGAFRPGHFRGVATVVAKLFNIVAPDKAYFGEKDAQQLAIIERMVADLNFPIEIVPVPIVREADGLALSSRNRRLGPADRAVAPALFQALQRAAARVAEGCGSAAEVRNAAFQRFAETPQMRVEYFEVVDPATMSPVERISGPVRIAAAVWLGGTRLIDNVYCAPPTRRGS
jgi:pantoate--beta-alanine ligase